MACAGCGRSTEPTGHEPIHVSFLDNESVLDSTAKFLKHSGCNEDGVFSFVKAVKAYNSTPLQVDLSGFPHAVQGVFTFQSVTQLVGALHHKLRDTPHAFEINCYDTVFDLTEGQFKSALKPDDVFGLSLAPALVTNGQWSCFPTATARDAFMWSCPLWYLNASNPFIPKSSANSRMNVIAALYGYYVLPLSTRNTELPHAVLETLRANWERQRITFPTASEVVLCHGVDLTRHAALTLHAGLLFRRERGYTYVEKDSGSGPFVRLDFETERALLPWLASKVDRYDEGPQEFFATFNNTRIVELNVSASSAAVLSQANQPMQPTPR